MGLERISLAGTSGLRELYISVLNDGEGDTACLSQSLGDVLNVPNWKERFRK